MGARETALNVLIACRKEAGWSNGLLKDYIRRDRLDRREAALATRLCYGVLQNRYKLDHYLNQLLTGKLQNLHPAVRDILHLGLYQLLEMDKIPASAAVNEAVTLTKKYCRRNPSAPALVNGVLRRADRERETLLPPKGWEGIYSHPQKLIDVLLDSVGKANMEAMLRANNEIPPTVAQVNTLRTDALALQKQLETEGVSAELHPWLPDCLVLTGTGDLENLRSFQEGLFYIQDAAAKLSVLCAQLPQNARVLDCCAAPGGKSFAASIALGGTGTVFSCDVHPHKVALLEKGAQRLGLGNITAALWDGTKENPNWVGTMDAVIADVPCSGYGIIRKKPDIRFKDPDSMKELPPLQKQILDTQARYVKPGGVLLYSTCTLLRQENELQVEAFLKNHPEFTLETLPLFSPLPAENNGMLTLVPGQYDTDGFFISRLRKKL